MYDRLLQDIADYVLTPPTFSPLAYDTAKLCWLDAMGCAILAHAFEGAKRFLGPWVPGTVTPNGARVIGTAYALDPIKAAFDNGMLIRYLDYNDTWLAKEWGHPSDNLGGILSVMDHEGRAGRREFTMNDCFSAMIMAYEIQGMMAISHAFNGVGLDHVILVKLATTAVCTMLLGGDRDAVLRALSLVFVDGQSLRTYRHAPNTGSRKSWAAGDATARGVQLAMMAMKGEMGYPTAVTAKTWGFQDASFRGQTITPPVFGNYVMENILFKVAYPAEFHAQTAVEAALILYPDVKHRLNDIAKIVVETQEAGVRIIDKTGPLKNYADRDHCLQYMIAVPLLTGSLDAHAYDDVFAADPRIDALRALMEVSENKAFTRDYLDLSKRAIPNSIQVFFNDGSHTARVQVDYPLGHRERRDESLSLLREKAKKNLSTLLSAQTVDEVLTQCESESFRTKPVSQTMTTLTTKTC